MNIPNLNAIRDWANKKFSLVSATGCDLGLSIDTSTYVMTLELKNSAGQVLSSKTIDFPIESMVVNASYKDGKLTLTLQNGQTLEVDISAIVSGLVNDARTIAGLDLKDDITKEELITALGIPAWAMTANKPSYTAAEVGALPSDTKIPTTVAELTDAKDYAKTTDVEALSGRMDTAESDIETLETSTAALGGRLDTAEQNITNQDTRLTGAEDTINQHSSHIAEISEEIKVEKSVVVDDYALVDSGSGVLNDLMLYGRSHQDGTPTPENPSAIRALDGIKTQSKNIWDALNGLASETTYGVTAKVNGDSVIVNGTATGTFNFYLKKITLDVGTYTISGCPKNNDNCRIIFTDGGFHADNGDGDGYTFTLTEEKEITAFIRVDVGKTANNLVFRPMIEVSNSKSDYVPYGHTESALPTLYGIPVDEGGNYVDKDGQHWWSDVLELEKGEITRYIVHTKGADIMWHERGNLMEYYAYVYGLLKIVNTKCISTHFQSGAIWGMNDKNMCGVSNGAESFVFIGHSSFDSLEDLNTFMQENDVEFYSFLATPVTEPIPQSVLNTLRQLRSFADKTHIYCDNGSLEAVIAENTEVGNAIGRIEEKIAEPIIKRGVVYGFHVSSEDSNPSSAVTYLMDAVGMIPARMDYDNGKFRWGTWHDAFFMPRPCMLRRDGTVAYYLNENDYSKKEDGTPSDIANEAFDGNAMMEWGRDGKRIWYKIVADYDDPTSYSVFIADHKEDNSYVAWSFYNKDDVLGEHFYTPIYSGSLDANNKLRSLSGKALMNSKSGTQEISYAKANGESWNIEVWSDKLLMFLLLYLMGKSLDLQTTYGQGHSTGGSSASSLINTGTLNDMGLFFGYSSTDKKVKVFGMEDQWGERWNRTAGLMLNNGIYFYKMVEGTADGTTSGYRTTNTNGMFNGGASPTTNNYVSKFKAIGDVILPNAVSGSSSTYYCDCFYQNQAGVQFALVGGASDGGAGCGFCVNLGVAVSHVSWAIGAALSCKPLKR